MEEEGVMKGGREGERREEGRVGMGEGETERDRERERATYAIC